MVVYFITKDEARIQYVGKGGKGGLSEYVKF